jgi:pimeloyl-ACP methyl ester carboxylesterase
MAALTRRAPLATQAIAAQAPSGDGSAILVLPGVFRTDAQTADLRRLLNALGYVAYGWELGRNFGPTRVLMRGALARLTALAEAHGTLAVVGFSMGGLFARWLAVQAPHLVRQVITIGSPWRAPVHSACVPAPLIKTAWRGQNLAAMADAIEGPLPVPATSLFSQRDGIVSWESCRDPATPEDNIEVACSHVMMEQDADVFRHVADRLARHQCPPNPANRNDMQMTPDRL